MLTKRSANELLLFIRYQETIRIITDKKLVHTLYTQVLRTAYTRELREYVKEFALNEGYDLMIGYNHDKETETETTITPQP